MEIQSKPAGDQRQPPLKEAGDLGNTLALLASVNSSATGIIIRTYQVIIIIIKN